MLLKDAAQTHWLEWFVGDHRSPKVFKLANGYFAATNGVYAVVSKEPCNAELEDPKSKAKAIDKFLTDIETVALSPLVSVRRDVLMSKIGACEYPTMCTCFVCHGSREVPHKCDCELCEADVEDCSECEGKGNRLCTPDTRTVTIFGSPVNANLIAYVLANTPDNPLFDSEYQFGLLKTGDVNDKFVIRTPNWYAVITGLTLIERKDVPPSIEF
jgi:hypothetical protein